MDINNSATYKDRAPEFLPRGRLVRRTLRSDPSLEYLVYVPSSGGYGTPVLGSVHGISRNVHGQANIFLSLCESYGVTLVAANFTEEQHADYQRLGRLGRGQRADLFLNRCLDEVATLTGANTTQIHLFGYSGGAQFAHRYLMAHPHRVAGAVVAAAGWYTFPSTQVKFPYGILSSRKLSKVIFNPEEFLRVPVNVLVGERDVDLTQLRSNPLLDEQQGKNRVERAQKWVATMRAVAETYGIEPCASYTEIPAIGHAFSEFCQRGALAERVFRTLFETSTERSAKKEESVTSKEDLGYDLPSGTRV